MTDSLQFDLTPEEQEVFCLEAEEMIGRLDTGLLAAEQGRLDAELVQQLFRAAHTLKGSAGSIGHQRMAGLTHAMEAVLELLRQNQLVITPEITDLLLQAVDLLRALNQEVITREDSGVQPAAVIARLRAVTGAGDPGDAHPAAAAAVVPANAMATAGCSVEPLPSGAAAIQPDGQLMVAAQIAADSIAPAVRALQVLMALDEIGKVVSATPERGAVEKGADVKRIEVVVSTSLPAAEVQQRLNRISELTRVDVSRAAQPASNGNGSGKGNGNGNGKVAPAEPATARAGQVVSRMDGSNIKTVRTSVERLDKLMNLVGELVTDRNRLIQSHSLLNARYQGDEFVGNLAQAISHLATITDELQEEVMRARMLPLENAFAKLPRVVRDLARDAGKSIVLEIEGQDTELDRTVIEEISDPLLHLLRNSVDHGIEPPDVRRAAGKPETGTIRLSGRSEGNHIIITVTDDGRGIDPEKVKRSAINRGFLTEDAAARMTDVEAYELIFLPGLSTADKVTGISGRGVGMDVVRNNIERLHGSVAVKSELGQGTTFDLRLPLTLAIMPVLLVGLAGYTYCIPLTSITEVLEVDPTRAHRVDRGEVVLWRERLLPLLHMHAVFGLNGCGQERTARGLPTVAVRWGEEHVGLVVDRLLGQQEIVVKSLGHMIGQVAGISGSAILGDGSVALIIDVPGLVKRASRIGAEAVARVAQ